MCSSGLNADLKLFKTNQLIYLQLETKSLHHKWENIPELTQSAISILYYRKHNCYSMEWWKHSHILRRPLRGERAAAGFWRSWPVGCGTGTPVPMLPLPIVVPQRKDGEAARMESSSVLFHCLAKVWERKGEARMHEGVSLAFTGPWKLLSSASCGWGQHYQLVAFQATRSCCQCAHDPHSSSIIDLFILRSLLMRSTSGIGARGG